MCPSIREVHRALCHPHPPVSGHPSSLAGDNCEESSSFNCRWLSGTSRDLSSIISFGFTAYEVDNFILISPPFIISGSSVIFTLFYHFKLEKRCKILHLEWGLRNQHVFADFERRDYVHESRHKIKVQCTAIGSASNAYRDHNKCFSFSVPSSGYVHCIAYTRHLFNQMVKFQNFQDNSSQGSCHCSAE